MCRNIWGYVLVRPLRGAHFFGEKMKNLTVDELMLLNLYELRLIGRKIGVKAPTSMSKINLVNAILDVLNGKIAPQRSSKGRPLKSSCHRIETLKFCQAFSENNFDFDDYLKRLEKILDQLFEKLKCDIINQLKK